MIPFAAYVARYVWKQAFLRYIVKQNIISEDERSKLDERYRNGLDVYFQPITGNENDSKFTIINVMSADFGRAKNLIYKIIP